MDAFDRMNSKTGTVSKKYIKNGGKGDAFDRIPEKEESFIKNVARTSIQPGLGALEGTSYGIGTGLWNFLGRGESLDPEELEQLKRISSSENPLSQIGGDEPTPFDEEKYREAVDQASGTIPTISNLSSAIERKTGLPLEAKTKAQKLLRFAGTVAQLSPDNLIQRSTAAAVAPAVKEGLEQLGLPEEFSELIALPTGVGLSHAAPKGGFKQVTKPSGLPKRQFEDLKETRDVSAKKIEQINKTLEKDFKQVADDIIKDSPVGETAKNLKDNAAYKQETRDLLNEAQVIADSNPKKYSTKPLKKEIADISKADRGTGYLPGEYDKAYSKNIKEMISDIKKSKVTASDWVAQYRKNNNALKEYFEPGQSKATNRAKRDALLDHNRAIAKVMKKEMPDSPLVKAFEEGNDRWSKIMDAENIDSFVTDLFDGKVNFKEAHKFFDKEGYSRPFKRALGDKGYAKFETLVKDLATSEAPYKMLKVAESKGFGDLATTAGAYILHPKLAGAKLAVGYAKGIWKDFMNSSLDKPKLIFELEKGITQLKKGDFAKANETFKSIENETISKEEAFGKYQKHKSSQATP